MYYMIAEHKNVTLHNMV